MGRLTVEFASRHPMRVFSLPKLNPPSDELHELLVEALHIDEVPGISDFDPDFDWLVDVDFDGTEEEFWFEVQHKGLVGGSYQTMWESISRILPEYFTL